MTLLDLWQTLTALSLGGLGGLAMYIVLTNGITLNVNIKKNYVIETCENCEDVESEDLEEEIVEDVVDDYVDAADDDAADAADDDAADDATTLEENAVELNESLD